jgi:hypothetical protein
MSQGVVTIRVCIWRRDSPQLPQITELRSTDSAQWHQVHDPSAVVDLKSVLAVEPSSAVRIDTLAGDPDLAVIVRCLPSASEFAGWKVWEHSTGDADIDAINDDGGMPVVIDGWRWALFCIGLPSWPPSTEFRWLQKGPDLSRSESLEAAKRRSIEDDKSTPCFNYEVAYRGTYQTASMTGGLFAAWVARRDENTIYFGFDQDEDGLNIVIEPAGKRTNDDLVEALIRYDSHPNEVPLTQRAFEQARSLGGVFEGYASDLISGESETLAVEARISQFSN